VDQTWWPDFLENLLGGDSEDEYEWFPSSDLPGISEGDDLLEADFQWPFD